MASHCQVIVLLVLFTSSVMTYPQKSLLDPIDLCILSCDDCYKGLSLMDCANECLMTGGHIGVKWITTCHRFKIPTYERDLENETI